MVNQSNVLKINLYVKVNAAIPILSIEQMLKKVKCLSNYMDLVELNR